MPKMYQDAISTILVEHGLLPHEDIDITEKVACQVSNNSYEAKIEKDTRGNTVTIGSTRMLVNDEKFPHLIPNPNFLTFQRMSNILKVWLDR